MSGLTFISSSPFFLFSTPPPLQLPTDVGDIQNKKPDHNRLGKKIIKKKKFWQLPLEKSWSQVEYAKALRDMIIKQTQAYAEIMDKNESLNKKIRLAEKQRVPLIVVIGAKEVESKVLSIRDRREKTQYELSESDLIAHLNTKIGEVHF